MDKTVCQVVLALLVLLALLWIAPYAIRGPLPFANSPWHRLAPSTRQLGAMHRICNKLRDYHYYHPNIRAEEMTGRTIADYVALGVLAPEDATYIRDHHIAFHGFDPNKIGGDIVVLEALFPGAPPRRKIFAYSDSSAALSRAEDNR